ncbi:MAG: LamG-like jellyroll fold domain-containing protein, partial [Bacteroidota bacterium]
MKNSLAQFYHFHYEDIGRTSLRLLFLVVTLALLSIGSAQAQQEREGMILIPFGKDLHVSNPTNRPMGLNGEMTVESWVWVGPNLDLPFFGFKGEASEDGIIAVRYLAGQTNKWQVVLRDIQSAPAGLVYKYDLPYKSDYSGTTTIGGSWNHIAVTLSGNSFKLYINGELAVEEGLRQAANHPWPNILPRGEGNRTFGGDLFGLRRTFWMSEVRIWKSVLEEAEIAEYYDEEVNVNHPHWDDLVRYYHGTEQSSGSFPSRSPNYAYDAVGDAELSTDLSVVGSFPVVKPPRIGDLADLQAEDCVWEDLTLDVDWEELNDLPDYINGNNVSYQLSRNGVEVRRKDTDDYDEKNHVGGSVYEYALRTYWNIDGVPYYSDDAATVEARVREQVDPPTGFSATRDECGGIELTWNSPNTPQYWRIQRGTDDHFNFWDEYIASDIDGGVNRYTDETASPERDFYYRIQAYGEGDNGCDVFGEWTTADVIGFTRETPRAPNNLSLIQDLDNKELQLTWNNRDDLSTDGYVVKREKLDGSDVTYFTIDGKDNTSFTDNGIELCQTYRYTVGSFNECNSDEESDANFASSDVTGNISQDLTNMISAFDASKAYYPDRVRLEWDVFGSLSQVDRFRISRSPAGENNFDLIAVVADGLIYDDETAIGGVLYDYKVAAEAQCEDKIIISNEMIDVGFITSYGVANGHIEYEGGNPVEDVAVTVERTNGKQVGHSVQFTGSDYLETTESFSFENDALTIEFWAKKEADEAGDLFDWNNGDAVPAPGQILKISYTSDGSINVYGGSGYEFIYNETNDKSDEWTHWAYVYDNAEVLDSRLYKNGELVMEGDLNSVDNNSMIDNNDFFAKLGNEFEGNLDELRVWNIARTAEEIQRDYGRIINAANSDLKLYYRFDEGIGTNTYDVSSDGIIFNKVDAVFTNLSEFSDDIPTSSQLGVRGVTDQFGDYSIEYIPYLGGGEVFRAVPSLGQHEFSPNSRSIFVGDGSKTANGLDFLDISSFEVIGVVRYDNTDFPVEGAVLKIDGVEVVGPDNKVVRTGADGKFTINVPIGYHYISVEKDGHTFSKGHFPELDEFGSIVTYEFNGPLGGEIEFFDDTKVTVVGKVAGGSVEAGKKSGFGIGFNNVDVADVEFQLQSLGYDLATDDDAITDIFTVQTDATTGEYIIELIPESWVVNKAGNDTYFTEADDLPVIDLSANIYPVEETEVIDAETEADSTIVYNKRQDFIIRVTPQVSLLDSEGNPFSGNETISYVDGENTVELDLSSADNPFPFIMVEKNRQYESVVKVKEVYYNPNHPVEGAYYDEVNVEGAEISIVNNLSERSPSAEGTTNADGEFSHDFYVGPPDVSINPIERNKSFTRNLEVYVVTPGQSLELIKTAYILGDRVIDGTDFVTYGAEIPQIVLHDPPGSNSYAYVETGSSFSGAKSWEYSNSSSTSLDHVTYAGSDLDLGGPGATAPTRFWNNAEYGMEISKGFSYNGEYVETFTFNRRIETSSDPEDVGSMADVYIGTADNLFMSRTNRLRVMLKADADAAGHSYIQPDAGSDLVLAVSQGLAITDKEAPTIFVYTQRHIIENVIPTLMELRDDLLLNSGKYTTNQPPESRWFGLNNDNPSLIADNPGSSFSDNLSYEFLLDPADEMDSVAFLNQQISTWISTIALNEAQKIESTLVNNISIDGSVGAYEASTEQDFTTSFNYTRTHNWDAYANADFGTFTAGNGFNLRYDFDLGIGLETSDEDAITNTIKFGYVIDESDVGDYYSIDIKTNDDISVYNKNKFSGWYPNKRELVDNLFLGGGGYIATGAVGGAKLGAYGLVMRRISKFVTESSVRKSAVAGAVFFAADVAFHIADLTQMSMYTNEVVEDMSGNLEFDVSNFMISSPIFSIRGGASS